MQKIVNEIFIFDIDGVITDINTHNVEEEKLLNFVVSILQKNEPVAFNTGRPLSWVKEELTGPIQELITDRSLLNNLYTVVEKGGGWISFDDSGKEILEIDESINIPEDLKNALRILVKDKFQNKIFYDEDKKTMATLQKEDNISLDEFNIIHPKLNTEVKQILQIHDPEGKFKYVPTTLDTDIESVKVGKDFAMGKILEWLKVKKYEPKKFITFGDSISDLDMARHLNEEGHQVNFVYVGEKEIIVEVYNFPIVITTEKYDKGTLEYLQSI